ncbi:MAG: single-stranded DNA-binding protein [Solobacterium sp.]|nr:single-stranded DNA-binding protein [Solobacterium sp.]
MNECVVVGRLMQEPEIRKTTGGNTVASILLECDKNFRDEDGTIGTDVFHISVWRGAAEQAARVLKPGHMIAVRGRLSGRMVQKEDRTYYFCEVIAEHIDYLRGLNQFV